MSNYDSRHLLKKLVYSTHYGSGKIEMVVISIFDCDFFSLSVYCKVPFLVNNFKWVCECSHDVVFTMLNQAE